ncbi:hypothetical protein LguiB_028615 [Lonicera macranthoides]
MEGIPVRLLKLETLYFPRALQSSAINSAQRKSLLLDLLSRDVPVFLEVVMYSLIIMHTRDLDPFSQIMHNKCMYPQIIETHVRPTTTRPTEGQSLSTEEMEDRMDQFTFVMQQKFMSGDAHQHLDYSKINEDESLDDHWMREANQDAEEKYFDDV